MPKRALVGVDLSSIAFAAGCGGGDEGGGARTINFYSYNEPGGAYDAAVATCNKAAKGAYKIPTSGSPATRTSSASSWSGAWRPRTRAST